MTFHRRRTSAQVFLSTPHSAFGTELFRMSVKVESDVALRGTLTAGVRVSRTADPGVSDTGGISVFVR